MKNNKNTEAFNHYKNRAEEKKKLERDLQKLKEICEDHPYVDLNDQTDFIQEYLDAENQKQNTQISENPHQIRESEQVLNSTDNTETADNLTNNNHNQYENQNHNLQDFNENQYENQYENTQISENPHQIRESEQVLNFTDNAENSDNLTKKKKKNRYDKTEQFHYVTTFRVSRKLQVPKYEEEYKEHHEFIKSFGPEGYGIFNMLNEKLLAQPEYILREKNYNDLAIEFNTTPDKIKNVVENSNLFVFDDDIVFSEIVKKKRIQLDKIRQSNKRAGKLSAKSRIENTQISENPHQIRESEQVLNFTDNTENSDNLTNHNQYENQYENQNNNLQDFNENQNHNQYENQIENTQIPENPHQIRESEQVLNFTDNTENSDNLQQNQQDLLDNLSTDQIINILEKESKKNKNMYFVAGDREKQEIISITDKETITNNVVEDRENFIVTVFFKNNRIHILTNSIPTREQVEKYVNSRDAYINVESYFDHYNKCDWKVKACNKYEPMRDWRGTIRTWIENDKNKGKIVEPTKEYVIDFFKSQLRETQQANDFYNYYKAVGWKRKGDPIADWKALALFWMNNKPKYNNLKEEEKEETVGRMKVSDINKMLTGWSK